MSKYFHNQKVLINGLTATIRFPDEINDRYILFVEAEAGGCGTPPQIVTMTKEYLDKNITF